MAMSHFCAVKLHTAHIIGKLHLHFAIYLYSRFNKHFYLREDYLADGGILVDSAWLARGVYLLY